MVTWRAGGSVTLDAAVRLGPKVKSNIASAERIPGRWGLFGPENLRPASTCPTAGQAGKAG